MARLRPVTGYPGAWDWTEGVNHPQDDGLFVVDVKTGARKLIVSFRQMRDALVAKHPEIDDRALFLNHTLWNREGDRIFFFVRADFNDPKRRVNVPMTVRPDGSELIEQRIFIGGHPEWDFKSRMIGRVEDKLVLYDTLAQQIVETIGGPEMFRDPEGDTALSRDGRWIVNGAHDRCDDALHDPAAGGPRRSSKRKISAAPAIRAATCASTRRRAGTAKGIASRSRRWRRTARGRCSRCGWSRRNRRD